MIYILLERRICCMSTNRVCKLKIVYIKYYCYATYGKKCVGGEGKILYNHLMHTLSKLLYIQHIQCAYDRDAMGWKNCLIKSNLKKKKLARKAYRYLQNCVSFPR